MKLLLWSRSRLLLSKDVISSVCWVELWAAETLGSPGCANGQSTHGQLRPFDSATLLAGVDTAETQAPFQGPHPACVWPEHRCHHRHHRTGLLCSEHKDVDLIYLPGPVLSRPGRVGHMRPSLTLRSSSPHKNAGSCRTGSLVLGSPTGAYSIKTPVRGLRC